MNIMGKWVDKAISKQLEKNHVNLKTQFITCKLKLIF